MAFLTLKVGKPRFDFGRSGRHHVRTMNYGNSLIVCEDGTDAPVAKLDGNGNLECYLNGFGGLVEGRG